MKLPIDIPVELWALSCMISALINTHPDKPKLRAAFESITDQAYARGIIVGVSDRSKKAIQATLHKYYAQLDSNS